MVLNVLEDLIDFGSEMSVGENTGEDNATTTIVNIGNSPLNTNLSGVDMNGNPSGTITVDNIKWSLKGSFDYPVEGTVLTSYGQNIDLSAPKATTTSVDSLDKVYWGISIPFGTDKSEYYGNNTFSVILDSNDW